MQIFGRAEPWRHHAMRLALAGGAVLVVSGCASTYGNLVSGSNLGAQEYQPAVLVTPGHEAMYQQVLTVCRNAAVNRQVTSAQEAQLRTITGSVSGATSGAAAGWQVGGMLKGAGLNTSINRSIGVGLGAGLLASLGSSFASGANESQADTKNILLSCLRMAEPSQQRYKVLE